MAMDSLDAGASVLVAAPTGSGKTLIAEYGIHHALAMGLRAFYTAPIKALSNQKYRDLVEIYGRDAVGLVTGDNAVNPEARIVVMTTEVLRNMIYASSERLDQLAVVVLDEVHFLQDAYRGPVWEEVIIQLDDEVQLVCLSATVSNAHEVGEWLTTVRGRTDVIVETTRPVELLNHFALFDAANGQVEMFDTLVGGQPNRAVERLMASTKGGGNRRGGHNGRHGPKRRFSAPNRPEIVELLEDNSMLPAIVFIFSRAQCEEAVKSCIRDGIVLTSLEEEEQIRQIVADHTESLSSDDRRALLYDDFVQQITAGIACHHAGMIPMFKEAVEACFVRGLVKVVFATETLAVGINMPARAVVIEKLTKYTGEHHTLLKASEFAQLTGRAGRRGLDKIGHAITMWNPFVSFDQVTGLAMSRSFRLSSAFRPTFNMAVNMVRRHSEAGTHHLLNLSFAQFQADRDVVTSEAALERRRRELEMLEAVQAQTPIPEVDNSVGASPVEAEIALRALRPGDIVVFDASNIRGRGLIISTAARRSGLRLSVLTPSRKTVEVSARDLRSLPVRGAHVELPIPFEPARTEFIREAVARLTKARVDDVETRSIDAEGRHSFRDIALTSANIKRLHKEIEQLENRKVNRAGSVSARFGDVIGILRELDYVSDWALTESGYMLAGIFHESDLLVVECMKKGVFDKLSVPDLVATVSCLVYEPRGPDGGFITRWPSDTVRQRFKRMEKVSQSLQDLERSHGMSLHRQPNGGFAYEAAAWSQGRPLSKILDPELTPGDFVRTIRQLIDLLRQIATTATTDQLRQSAEVAVSSLDRGVVAAAATESVQ